MNHNGICTFDQKRSNMKALKLSIKTQNNQCSLAIFKHVLPSFSMIHLRICSTVSWFSSFSSEHRRPGKTNKNLNSLITSFSVTRKNNQLVTKEAILESAVNANKFYVIIRNSRATLSLLSYLFMCMYLSVYICKSLHM